MEGPSFHCAYLGFGAISKPPTNISVLQNPIKELYFQYRKSPANGRSANLKLIQKGVLVTVFENGVLSAELFLDFTSVTFVEAAKFVSVKASSDRKLKAMFVPVDDRKEKVSDKHAFSLEKNFHFLASTSHPPLVACVVRRPTGVKALDCHVFAIDTTENALHVSALIGSTGQGGKIDGSGDAARVKGNFDRGVRGDVIRTDHGEYSVYRGAQSYDAPPPQRYSGGPISEMPPPQRYSGGPVSEVHQHQRYSGGLAQAPGRNSNLGNPQSGMQGPIMLTQDIFREPLTSNQQVYGGGHVARGYGVNEHSNYGIPSVIGHTQPPDVIIHTHQRPRDISETASHDRSHSGSELSSGGVGIRYDEVNMRNNSNARISNVPVNETRLSGGQVPINRLSGGQVLPMNRLSGGQVPASRLSENQMPPGGKPAYSRPSEPTATSMVGIQRQSDFIPSAATPFHAMTSPMQNFSPLRDDEGPVFSASNLESRGQGGQPELQDQPAGGRPVAKVPPHMKGVKVLPSDFRMVKLKPKSEKRSESTDDAEYDNNKDDIETHKEHINHERDPNYAGGLKLSSTKTSYQDTDGFRDFSEQNKYRTEERTKEFLPQWNETIKENRSSGRGYDVKGNSSSNDSHLYGGSRDYAQRQEENNYRNKINDAGENWSNKSHAAPGDSQNRTKELEIANMFSNVKLQGGSNNYRQAGIRNEIEDGLGYLP